MSEESDTTESEGSSKGRRQLTIILVIALVSLGGSYLTFYFASSGSGWGTTNHGDFVVPETNMSELGWPDIDNRNWRLWVVANRSCDAICADKVTKMRALHILLAKEAGRVRRALTVKGIDTTTVTLPEAFPKLERVNPTRAQQIQEGVYIIDPNGNLVFKYALEVDPKFILEDFKKLLKLSQIG